MVFGLFAATCLGLVFAAPTEAIAVPNPSTTTFYERQINKLTYPTDINLGLPSFPTSKNTTQNVPQIDAPPPVQTIPDTLTQPDEEVSIVKLRKVPPALVNLGNQLKSQLKEQINLQIQTDVDSLRVHTESSRPDPYQLIAAARSTQSPLKSTSSLPKAPNFSQARYQVSQLTQRVDQAKTELQVRSRQKINTQVNKFQNTIETKIKTPLRQLLRKVERLAHRTEESLQ